MKAALHDFKALVATPNAYKSIDQPMFLVDAA